MGVYKPPNPFPDEFTDLQCDYVDQVVKCERLEKELLKSNTTSKSFEALSDVTPRQGGNARRKQEWISSQHMIKNDKSFKENQSNVFLKEREQYFEIQDLKAFQYKTEGFAISELKKLIEKMKGKSVETKFEKSSIIRQPNAFKSQRHSVLAHRDNSIHRRLWVLKAHDGKSQASNQENVPQAAETVTTSNELDLLFSPMFDELLNGTTQVASKSSVVNAAYAPDKRQQQNIQTQSYYNNRLRRSPP
ncbi:hypothetical protein Tco_0620927 [Tanacetum coccineum]